MAHQERNQQHQKKQIPADISETKNQDFRNKNLLQDKKDRDAEEAPERKAGFNSNPKKLGKRH